MRQYNVGNAQLQDAADVRHAREGAQAEYYRQFSFRPAINPRSRQMAQVRATKQWDGVHSTSMLCAANCRCLHGANAWQVQRAAEVHGRKISQALLLVGRLLWSWRAC
jgi:hypothetical protein